MKYQNKAVAILLSVSVVLGTGAAVFAEPDFDMEAAVETDIILTAQEIDAPMSEDSGSELFAAPETADGPYGAAAPLEKLAFMAGLDYQYIEQDMTAILYDEEHGDVVLTADATEFISDGILYECLPYFYIENDIPMIAIDFFSEMYSLEYDWKTGELKAAQQDADAELMASGSFSNISGNIYLVKGEAPENGLTVSLAVKPLYVRTLYGVDGIVYGASSYLRDVEIPEGKNGASYSVDVSEYYKPAMKNSWFILGYDIYEDDCIYEPYGYLNDKDEVKPLGSPFIQLEEYPLDAVLFDASTESTADIYINARTWPIATNNPIATKEPVPIEERDVDSGVVGGIVWNIKNSTLYLSGAGEMPEFTQDNLPPWYKYHDLITQVVFVDDEITTVGSYSFRNMNSLTGVTFPKGLVTIGESAFENCGELSGITLPDMLSGGIGENSFKNCVSMLSAAVPDGVQTIGKGAFEGCISLRSIMLPFIGTARGSSNTAAVFSVIFGDAVPATLKTITITDDTNIPDNAFRNLYYVENISVNDGISTMGVKAFENCRSLRNFKLPDGIKEIGDSTFRGCENITSVKLPDTVKSIGAGAFDGCIMLREVNIPEGVQYIHDYTFRDCASLTEIEIPGSVMSIGKSILTGCASLVEIKVPYVGANANPGATSVTPEGVFGYFFGGDNSTVPPSVTKVEITSTDRSAYIPKEAFKNCGNIVDVMIDGGRNVLDGAFVNCKNLKNLYIPKSISSIESNILDGCTRLETLTVPFIGTNRLDQNRETSVLGGFFGYDDADKTGTLQYYNENGDYHYYKVPRTLKSVSVLNQTTIPAGAFSECDFIERVAIVTGAAMNKYAFYHCASLKTVTLPNDLQTIGYQAFAECEVLETLNIPTKVKTIGEQAFYNARTLRNVTMPDSVTEIADDVFNGTDLLGMEAVNLMASGNGVITCSKDSAAYTYAVEKGIKTNVVSKDKLDIKKTATSVTLLSDYSYLFDVIDTNNMSGSLHIDLYGKNGGKLREKVIDANNGVEYRVEFAEEDMKNIASARVYITGANGRKATTEDEILLVTDGDIPEVPESDIVLHLDNGVISLTGTTPVRAGTVLVEAVYDDDGLSDINVYSVSTLEGTVNVTADLAEGTAKYMLWNSLEKMQPLADAITN